MSDTITQDERLIAVQTSLGEDYFLLTAFSGFEGVSHLFQFDLEMLAEDAAAEHTELVGQNLTFSIKPRNGTRSFFNGFISQFAAAEPEPNFGRVYRARIVPWLWFLTRAANSRIFQDMDVVDIAKKVFSEHGFNDFEFNLQLDYKKYEYKVQYRETDFNFISRLMEHEGIFYFFRHENGKHTAVFGDAPTVFMPGERPEAYFALDADWEHINEWHHAYEFQPGQWTLTDYDFKKPQTDLTAKQTTVIDNSVMKKFEIFDYPGSYVEKDVGDGLARTRMETEEAGYHLVHGQAMVPGFRSGLTFILKDHPIPKENDARYALLSVHHHARDTSYLGGSQAAPSYSNSFTCLPARTIFRPPRVTPAPVVHGPQTATVVGPSGEEIHTDEYGRIKVQFRWDRYGKADEKSSMFLRLSQSWAGKQWGAQILPRIGMEVIVEFLEGDPDKPIVTGCLYNATAMPADKLTDYKTRTVFRTNSSPGGNGFNEFSFEDKAGQEQVFLHGERDQDIRIKHDAREWIGQDRHLIVRRNQLERVDGRKHLAVGGDQNEKVTGTVSLEAGEDLHQKMGMNAALKAGMSVAIEAGISITLKAGASFIEIGPAGITIVGTPLVLINSGGSPGPLTAQPNAPAAAKEADNRQPGGALPKALTGTPPRPGAPPALVPETFSPQAAAMIEAAKSGTPFCAICAVNAVARAARG